MYSPIRDSHINYFHVSYSDVSVRHVSDTYVSNSRVSDSHSNDFYVSDSLLSDSHVSILIIHFSESNSIDIRVSHVKDESY